MHMQKIIGLDRVHTLFKLKMLHRLRCIRQNSWEIQQRKVEVVCNDLLNVTLKKLFCETRIDNLDFVTSNILSSAKETIK